MGSSLRRSSPEMYIFAFTRGRKDFQFTDGTKGADEHYSYLVHLRSLPRLSALKNVCLEITGGTFRRNKADFGGFLHTEGSGNATCSGALVQKNRGLDGGALYIVGANLMLQCDLVENDALVGPAM